MDSRESGEGKKLGSWEAGKNPILSHAEAQRTQRKAKDTIFIIKKLCELCVPERSGREEKIFHTEARKRGSGDF